MKKKVIVYLKPVEKEIEIDENLENEEAEREETRQILEVLEEEILNEAEIDYWE